MMKSMCGIKIVFGLRPFITQAVALGYRVFAPGVRVIFPNDFLRAIGASLDSPEQRSG